MGGEILSTEGSLKKWKNKVFLAPSREGSAITKGGGVGTRELVGKNKGTRSQPGRGGCGDVHWGENIYKRHHQRDVQGIELGEREGVRKMRLSILGWC